MGVINLKNINSISFPFQIYVCNVYGNGCIYLGTINTLVPPNNKIQLPIEYQSAPAVGIKIISSDGCERFEIVNCSELCGLLLQYDTNKDKFLLIQDNTILLLQYC